MLALLSIERSEEREMHIYIHDTQKGGDENMLSAQQYIPGDFRKDRLVTKEGKTGGENERFDSVKNMHCVLHVVCRWQSFFAAMLHCP